MFFRALILFLTLSGAALADPAPDLQKYINDPATLADIPAPARTELDPFYASRGYRPAWNLADEDAIRKTLAFLASIETVIAYHGLTPASFRIDDMRKLATDKTGSDKEKLEILITASLLQLAHALHGDTIDLPSLYTGWALHRQAADMPALLAAATAGNLGAFFDQLPPQNKAYRDLAQALQTYRAILDKGGWTIIDSGAQPLRPHDTDPRVPQLRARLAAEGYAVPKLRHGQTDFFDDELSQTLVGYQINNGLQPDGHMGVKTQEALNMPVAARINQIRANMERARHMPENFPPDRYVLINIPDFSVAITEGGHEIYRGSVIVGRVDRQTPFIASRITNMLVNPSWHVPLKIARKDILPKLRRDPHYLEKQGFVIAGRDDDDPSGVAIDWKHMKPERFHYELRQIPGDLNSLGQLKFNFVNPFDVYMHGTPHQELFEKAERDFSSGCIRLQDPIRVGEVLLTGTKDKTGIWDAARIQTEIDTAKTRWVPLARPMPVYILYQTVFTGADGQINFRKDIYGYDALLSEKMKAAPPDGP